MIAERLAQIRKRIDTAIERRGPGPEVRLIGVSKKQPLERLRAALAAGLDDLGENYAQELRDRITALGSDPPHWHFIGAVQTNKVKYLVGRALIHTADRPRLVDAIAARAQAVGVTQDVLVEVNPGEAHKAGAAPEDIPALLDHIATLAHIRCRGLMIIPPVGTVDQTRPHFRALRDLRDRLAQTARPNVDLRELSMGMSSDYEAAIEEGATMVRVGTAIFGQRPGPPA